MKKSKVIFVSDPHSYWLGDRQLSGITDIIQTMLFPDKYARVPKSVMQKAGARGSAVHEDCEMIDFIGAKPTTIEGEAYVKLKETMGWKPVRNEFLVSDEERIATKIDVIYESDIEGTYDLGDFKTTSEFDKEYLSWQLSTCAWLFELQTGLKAGKLFGIWLRGDYTEVAELERKSVEQVKDVFDRFFRGVRPEPSVPSKIEASLPEKFKEAEALFEEWEKKKAEYEAKDKQYREMILNAMLDSNVKKWIGEKIAITLTDAHTTTKTDIAVLKSKYPEIYKEVQKQSNVKASVTIKLKNND